MKREPIVRGTLRLVPRMLSGLAAFALWGVGSAAAQPPVTLNHVVVVVDSETYRAIGQSAFLRDQFAGFQERTTKADGGTTWSGTYLFGQNTYIEMFAPGGIAGPLGGAMVGFGVEKQGALWPLRKRLAEAAGRPVDSLLRNRAREAEQVPWFYAVAVQGAMTTSRFPTWAMEYHPDYQRLWDKKTGPVDLRRSAFLTEWYRPDRLLGDVVAVTAAVDSADQDRVTREARAFGYTVTPSPDRVVLKGPDITLSLTRASATVRGVTALGLKLTRHPETALVEKLGPRSVLRIERDGTATWTF